MRTFTYTDEKSNKFWNIELQGTGFTVTYGRLGTTGQTQTKTFATPEKAQAEHDKLVREKTSKGYVETTPGAGGVPGAPPASQAASTGAVAGLKSTRQILEAALYQNPDDVATHSAYADLLIEEGDPRGEFIHTQLQLEDETLKAAARKKLAKREQEILADHLEEWLGTTAEYLLQQRDVSEWMRNDNRTYQYRFERGWLASLRIPSLNLRSARVFTRNPVTRMLRELTIDETDYEDGYTRENGDEPQPGVDDLPEDIDEEDAQLLPLFKAPFLPTLRKLVLGEMVSEQYDDYCPFNCHFNGERAADLVERCPNLEELRLLCHRVNGKKLFGLKTLSKVRILQLYHSYDYPLDRLAKNAAFANLTHLLLHPHALDEEEASLRLPHIRAVCRSTVLTKLEHLQIRLCDAGDAGVKEIVESGILKRLKTLDLRHGRITDDGAKMLAECADVKHLQHLDLSRNRLTPAGVALIEALKIPTTILTYQASVRPGADEYEDNEYLYAGDIE